MSEVKIKIPEFIDVPAFAGALEAVAEKLLSVPEYRDRLARMNPILLDKTMLAQETATLVLDALMKGPSGHLVVLDEAHGADRWHCSGTYRFIEPIPGRDVLAAFLEAGLARIAKPARQVSMKRGKVQGKETWRK